MSDSPVKPETPPATAIIKAGMAIVGVLGLWGGLQALGVGNQDSVPRPSARLLSQSRIVTDVPEAGDAGAVKVLEAGVNEFLRTSLGERFASRTISISDPRV